MAYLSHSQIELLKPGGCPMKHWFRYHPEGKRLVAEAGALVGPYPVHLSYGTSVHAGAEAAVNYKIAHGEDPDLSVLWEAFEAKWIEELEAHPDMDFTGPDRKEQSPARLVLDGKAQLRQFHQQILPQIVTPLAAELRILAPVAGFRGMEMIGYIDILGYDGRGELTVWDLKTGVSAKDWTQDRADHENQPPSYFWQLQKAGQPVPAKFIFVVLVRGLYGRAHKVIQLTTRRTQEQIDAYGVQVTYAAQLKVSGFHAPNPQYPYHSRCEFLGICPHGDPVPAAVEAQEAAALEEMDL